MKQYFYNWYYHNGLIELHRGIKADANVKTVWHYGVFDMKGNMILDIVYDSTTIYEKHIVFRKKELSGVTDKKGNILLEPIYKRINFSKYGIIAWVDGIIKFFNQKGQFQFKLSDEGQTVFWDNDFFIKIKREQGNKSFYSILNLNGEIILDNINYCTFLNSHIQYKPEEYGHNYGLVDRFGNEIAKPIYKYIHPIGKNFILTQENKAYLINKNGVCLVECTKIDYTNIANKLDSMLVLEKNGTKHLADINGNVLLGEAIESCYQLAHNDAKPEDGLYGKLFEEYSKCVIVQLLDGKRGIFKNNGTYAIKPVFNSIFFSTNQKGLGNARFLIKKKGLFKKVEEEDYQKGFVNGDGTILMDNAFDYGVLYDNSLIPSINIEEKKLSRWFTAKNDKKTNITTNHVTIKGAEFYFVQDGMMYCMYSKNGNRLSDLYFDGLFSLNENLFIVTANKKMGLLDRSGHMITSVEFDYFYTPDHGVIRFIKNGFHGLMSENGTVIVDPIYSMIYQYVDGIARTSSGLNISKRIEGRRVKEDYGKEGLIDLQGRTILKPICDQISFIHNVFRYKIDNKYGIVDKKGAAILEPLYDSVEVKDKIFIIEKNNMFGVADRSGRIIAEPKYEKSRGDCFKIDTPDERKLVLHNGQVIDINEVLGEYIINNSIRKELHPVHQDIRTLKNNNEFETDKVKDAVVKILSFLTGSSKETLLNVKSDIKKLFDNHSLSNYQEKKHVFQRLINDMPNILKIDEIKSLPMYEILAQMIEIYEESNEEDFLQMINRVLVHFYQIEFEKNDKFIEAFLKFSADFEKFAENLIETPYTLKYRNKEELVKDMAETFLIVASDKYGEKDSRYNMKQMTKLELLSFFNESIKDEKREKVEELMKWVQKFYGHDSSNLEAFMLDIEGYLYTSV